MFTKNLVIVSFIATVFGAFVDGFLVIKPIYNFQYSNYFTYSTGFNFDVFSLSFALILIMISFVFLCRYILDMNLKYSYLAGIYMMILNGLFWYLNILFPSLSISGNEGFVSILIFFIVAVIIYLILFRSFIQREKTYNENKLNLYRHHKNLNFKKLDFKTILVILDASICINSILIAGIILNIF